MASNPGLAILATTCTNNGQHAPRSLFLNVKIIDVAFDLQYVIPAFISVST